MLNIRISEKRIVLNNRVLNNRRVLSKAELRSKQHFLKKLKVKINIDKSEIISPRIDEWVKIGVLHYHSSSALHIVDGRLS